MDGSGGDLELEIAVVIVRLTSFPLNSDLLCLC